MGDALLLLAADLLLLLSWLDKAADFSSVATEPLGLKASLGSLGVFSFIKPPEAPPQRNDIIPPRTGGVEEEEDSLLELGGGSGLVRVSFGKLKDEGEKIEGVVV